MLTLRKSSIFKVLFYIIYFLLVMLCMSQYLGDRSSFTIIWFISLLIILLPWSLVTGIIIIGSMYHGGKAGIPTISMVTALLNIITLHLLIYWITPKNNKTET